jgi:ribosome biogenesis protein YTM1
MPPSGSDSDNDGEQVRVSLKLSTSVQDRSLEVPSQPIAVPADIGRKGLSAVLNHLLGRIVAKESANDDSDSDDDAPQGKLPPLTFEFIVTGANNKLLRKGVEKEARQNGLSLEQAIEITYFPAAGAPEVSGEQEELPDWISCLSVKNSILYAGCYDGSVHLYRREGDDENKKGLAKIDSTVVSSSPVKCIDTTIVKNDDGENKVWIASACLDHTMHIHTYDTTDNTLQLYGHCVQEGMSCAMSSLSFSSSSKSLLASGDGNGTICIWDVQNTKQVLEPAKKQKTQKGKVSTKSITPTGTIESAHSQLVSGLSWGNHCTVNQTHLISGSWDHSLKLWDVEKQDCLLTLNGSRVVSCLDTSYHSEGVVATGHPDCTIRLWDVRTNNAKPSSLVSDNIFRPSHKAWVSSVQWSKTNPYHLASTSHDGTIKLWDIRSSVPLHTVRAFAKEEKGLCLVWDPAAKDSNGIMFAGGSDCIIKQLRL